MYTNKQAYASYCQTYVAKLTRQERTWRKFICELPHEAQVRMVAILIVLSIMSAARQLYHWHKGKDGINKEVKEQYKAVLHFASN